eukprot:Skav230630  [mRNA]  locus=scaffold1673:185658:192471:+ [translate_table: standard]
MVVDLSLGITRLLLEANEQLVSDLVPKRVTKRSGFRAARARADDAVEANALTKWEDDTLVPHTPAEGLLVRQQEAWHRRLEEDRILEWHHRMMDRKELLKKMLEKPRPPAPVVDELPPAAVEENPGYEY